MGLGGISIWQLLVVLAIVIMVFGTKRLGSLGSDLGSAIKGFKKAISEDDTSDTTSPEALDKVKREQQSDTETPEQKRD